MPQLSILNAEQHKDLKIVNQHSAICAAQMQAIPIEASEVPNMSSQMPIFLSKGTAPETYALNSLSSLFKNHPLFVQDKRWLATHMPLSVQTAPFCLQPLKQAPDKLAIALDTEQDVFDASGTPLYSAGQPTEKLTKVVNSLQDQFSQSVQTLQFLEALSTHNLLKSIDIILWKTDESQVTLQGLYTVDEDALRNIDTSLLSQWHKNGYLMIAHAILLSMQQLNPLINRHNDFYPEASIRNMQIKVSELAS